MWRRAAGKMVSGDVFRSPKNATLLCVQLGSGIQIILSSFITLFFAALGALSPCLCDVNCPVVVCGTLAVRSMYWTELCSRDHLPGC